MIYNGKKKIRSKPIQVYLDTVHRSMLEYITPKRKGKPFYSRIIKSLIKDEYENQLISKNRSLSKIDHYQDKLYPD
jgi:hypothetical protein